MEYISGAIRTKDSSPERRRDCTEFYGGPVMKIYFARHGQTDWNIQRKVQGTTAIIADVKNMWYRFSRREDDYCIECSEDGLFFSQMRVCHVWKGAGKIRFGIYACSPENSSFKAVFTDLKITECAWKAHDGQQPD